MFEDSGSFRDGVDLDRYGVTPTLTFAPSDRTKVSPRYEYLNDARSADRGITSFQGRPVDVDRSTFYGNPADSDVRARVNVGVGHRRASGGERSRSATARWSATTIAAIRTTCRAP